MIKVESLNFHETFSPDFDYIAKILEIADNYEELTKEDISQLTGIPTGDSTGKVIPHIIYSQFMGIIDANREGKNFSLKTTSLGQKIKEEDPYFLENISKLICNYFLTSNTGAVMWNRIFRKMPINYGNNIKENIVIKELEEEFNIKINLSAFRSCYKLSKSFSTLNLMDVNSLSEGIIKFNKHIYEEENIYVYAYTLVKELEDIDLNRKEFSIDEIVENIGWNYGFCWNEQDAMEILDIFNENNIIKLNRQLNPITVVINKSSEELLEDLYSLLI